MVRKRGAHDSITSRKPWVEDLETHYEQRVPASTDLQDGRNSRGEAKPPLVQVVPYVTYLGRERTTPGIHEYTLV